MIMILELRVLLHTLGAMTLDIVDAGALFETAAAAKTC